MARSAASDIFEFVFSGRNLPIPRASIDPFAGRDMATGQFGIQRSIDAERLLTCLLPALPAHPQVDRTLGGDLGCKSHMGTRS
jgi:hypothetical protein